MVLGGVQSSDPTGPAIVREVDGTENDSSNTPPESLDELFDSRDESPKKRRKQRPDDDSHKAQEDNDETTE